MQQVIGAHFLRSRLWAAAFIVSAAIAPSIEAGTYAPVVVGDPSQVGGFAYALNDAGIVATTSLVRSHVSSDATYGDFAEIAILNTATSTPGVVAQGINDLGEVVGRFRTLGNPANQTSGFLRRSNGAIETFNHPSHLSLSISDINNLGGMVGETRSDLTVFGVIRGFLYDQGTYSEISFPGSALTRAYGINDAGDIVGQFQNDDAINRPFLLRNGVYQELQLVSPPGGAQSALATGISDSGLVIGTYRDAANATRTWVREFDGSYAYPELPGAGWGINDARQISGSFLDANNGNLRSGFVASPIPEPTTGALGLLVLVGVLTHRIGSCRRAIRR